MASIIKANQLQDFGGNSIITSDGAGTITLSSGMQTAVQSAGADNTPAFAAHLSGTQSVSDNTRTLVQYGTEIFDTDGAYSTSTYRFTPQTAGKYFVYASLSLYAGDYSAYEYGFIYIQKNTTDIAVAGDDLRNGNNGRWFTPSTATIVDMNGSSDYLEVDGLIGTSSSPLFYGDNHFSTFGAYKIIGA